MTRSFVSHLRHLFTPHLSNNFRARLLHNSGLVLVIGILFTANVFVRLLDNTSLHILGFTSTITESDVVRLTNQERISSGLSPLSYNETLADAARRKAANMFEENYWAHNSPSGKSPWVWFQQAGYNYTNAGENLAKDFGNADRLMSAWMNSPTHRDNIVSAKYQDIGVAVVPGTIGGQETVLVVQLFGTTSGGAVPQIAEIVAKPETKGAAVPEPVEPVELVAPPQEPTVTAPAPRIDEFDLKKTLSLVTTALLMLALVMDLIIAESSSLSRRVGKNWAHLLFVNVILILATYVQAGRIL